MICGFIKVQIRNKWNKMITSCTCTALYLLQRTFTASSLVSFFYTSGQPDDHINPPGSNTILKLVNIISLVLISSLNFKLIYHLLYISTWMSPKHITELYFFFFSKNLSISYHQPLMHKPNNRSACPSFSILQSVICKYYQL